MEVPLFHCFSGMYEEKNAVFRPQTPSITVEIRSIRVKFRIRTLLIRITGMLLLSLKNVTER